MQIRSHPESSGEHAQEKTEKKEGAFYVWTVGEFARLLGDDAPVASRRFGVEPHGNALADPQGEFEGQNILYVAQSIEDVATRTGQAGRRSRGCARPRGGKCSRRPAPPGPGLIWMTRSSRPGMG